MIPEYVRELFLANFMLKTKEKQHSYTNRLHFFSHFNIKKVHVRTQTICQPLMWHYKNTAVHLVFEKKNFFLPKLDINT